MRLVDDHEIRVGLLELCLHLVAARELVEAQMIRVRTANGLPLREASMVSRVMMSKSSPSFCASRG